MYAGAQTATGSPVALNNSTSLAVTVVLVQADPANGANNILVGNANAQPIVLTPGANASIRVGNITEIFIKASAGSPVCNWIAEF